MSTRGKLLDMLASPMENNLVSRVDDYGQLISSFSYPAKSNLGYKLDLEFKVVWKKKFALVPHMSYVSDKIIWLTWGYKGTVGGVPTLDAWHTIAEHTALCLMTLETSDK